MYSCYATVGLCKKPILVSNACPSSKLYNKMETFRKLVLSLSSGKMRDRIRCVHDIKPRPEHWWDQLNPVFLRISVHSFLGVGWDWVHLVRRPLFCLLYQPRMIDDGCGEVGGVRIGRRNRITRRKSATVPLYLPQIQHNLTWARTWAAALGSRRLTVWAMARPCLCSNFKIIYHAVSKGSLMSETK
jgi:hypothetical protein